MLEANLRSVTRWYTESWRSAGIATAIALLGGLLLGGVTSYGQTYLPDAVRSFANSAGGWTVLAFLLIRFGRARLLLAGVLGIVAFEALVEGYRLVSGWRGFFYARPFGGIFSLIGLVAGPVLGVSASLTRYGSRPWRLLGFTPLAAVLLGEGCYGLAVVGGSTSPVYWSLQIGAAVLIIAVAAARIRPGTRVVALAVALTLAGAAVFLLGYRALGSG